MMNEQVFSGIKVAEFAWVIVGPSTSRYLAEHGATIVKIESHKRLDTLRSTSPFAGNRPTVDSSMAFGRHNPNKYSVSIDLQHPNGRKLAWKLIQWADIVTESFSPGTMEKWGLGYEDVRKIKPDIIYLSSNMYGQTGPYASRGGFGGTLLSSSGLMHLTGWPEQVPKEPGYVYTDFIAPKFTLLALIAALSYRRKTGKGQHLDVSQMETIPYFQTPLNLEYQANGRDAGRIGNRSTYAAPHGVYRCKGEHRYCVITVFSDEEWRTMCKVIGRPELATDSRYVTVLNRLKNADTLDKLVEEWTIDQSAEEVMRLMQEAGIAAAVAQNGQDLDNDPQLKERGYFWEVDHPEIGGFPYHGMPVKSSEVSYEVKRSPCLGEHNEYVYTKLLGISDLEFAQLLQDGVFEFEH